MFQPHFLHFSIVKAAISLMDKVPMSSQQRFSRFSIWIREQDPPDHPFSYFTQIGVLWAGKCVFSRFSLILIRLLSVWLDLLIFFVFLNFYMKNLLDRLTTKNKNDIKKSFVAELWSARSQLIGQVHRSNMITACVVLL